MTVYEFQASNGDVIERDYRIGSAPKQVRVDGRVFKRIVSVPIVHFSDHVGGRDFASVGDNIPDHLVQHHHGETVTSHGRKVPFFRNRAESRSFERECERHGHVIHQGRPTG